MIICSTKVSSTIQIPVEALPKWKIKTDKIFVGDNLWPLKSIINCGH